MDQVAACLALISGQALNDRCSDAQIQKLMVGINNNNPSVLKYFEDSGPAEEVLLESKGKSEIIYSIPVNRRLFRDWLNPWAAKQAVALWFEHSGNFVSFDQRINVDWVSNEKFVKNGIPEDILKIFPEKNFMRSGRISFADQFSYFYGINTEENLGGFFVVLHNSAAFLATIFPAYSMIDRKFQFEFGSLFRVTKDGIEKCLTAPVSDFS